nr:hypothetical protein GCM10010200_042690 [Actinomadura rugatobispora]
MQGPSDSKKISDPEENGQSTTAPDSATVSTVLAEILPGVVAASGDVPEELKLEPIDLGFVSVADREQISTLLASIGNAATVGGNLANAFAGVEGLYRITDATRTLLNAGGTLAAKDGANLGAIFVNGKLTAQARFIPVSKVNAAKNLAAIGPALAMVALQMQLSEVTGLVRTNIALTSQVLTTMNHAQWATLTGLVETVDDAFREAQEVRAVTQHVWDTVATKKAELRTVRDQYQRNISGHIQKIRQCAPHGRREYLETNAAAIVFDAHALRASLEARTKYQVLRAAKVSAAGREDPDEARLVEVIARDTRAEHDSALAEMTSLVHSLTRELRIIAELPDRATMPLARNRRDSKAARLTCTQLLKAIQPLADALHPPVPPLESPDVVCAPASLDLDPYLRILRWFLEDGETLRVLGFPDQLDALGPFGATSGGAKEKAAAAKDKVAAAIDKAAKNLVAVTDRRIITARTNVFRKQGQLGQDIPIDRVRYVRAPAQDANGRSAIDIITADENIRLIFHADIDNAHVDALAAVLAESMTIPAAERDELQRRRPAALEAGKKGENTATSSTEAVTGDAE